MIQVATWRKGQGESSPGVTGRATLPSTGPGTS